MTLPSQLKTFYESFKKDGSDRMHTGHCYALVKDEVELRFDKTKRLEIYNKEKEIYLEWIKTATLSEFEVDMLEQSVAYNMNATVILRAQDKLIKMLFADMVSKNETIEKVIQEK